MEANKVTEVKEPENKIAKVDQMDISGSSAGLSASNTINEQKPEKSEVATSSKSIERLPCGAKPVFADFKFDNTER